MSQKVICNSILMVLYANNSLSKTAFQKQPKLWIISLLKANKQLKSFKYFYFLKKILKNDQSIIQMSNQMNNMFVCFSNFHFQMNPFLLLGNDLRVVVVGSKEAERQGRNKIRCESQLSKFGPIMVHVDEHLQHTVCVFRSTQLHTRSDHAENDIDRFLAENVVFLELNWHARSGGEQAQPDCVQVQRRFQTVLTFYIKQEKNSNTKFESQ